jgi:hypothetical protein
MRAAAIHECGGQAATTAARFFALVCTALILAPSIAHLASLPAKIGMDRASYFAAQAAYRGWALFGIGFVLAIAANLWLAVQVRDRRGPFVFAITATVLLLVTLGVFFSWVQPANAVTENWTVMPENWSDWRRQWEHGHAMIAVVTFAAFCCTALAVSFVRR